MEFKIEKMKKTTEPSWISAYQRPALRGAICQADQVGQQFPHLCPLTVGPILSQFVAIILDQMVQINYG